MIPHIDLLFAHLAWADERALRSLRESEHLPARALELFGHVLGAEHVWLGRIRGPAATVAVWPALSLADCDRLAAENHAAFEALIGSLDGVGLMRVVRYRNSAGAEFGSTVEEILTHVALHGAYHRGQLAALVRAAGDAPQPTDFIAFTRGAPTAARSSSPAQNGR